MQVLNLRDMEMIERVHARGGKFRYYPLHQGEPGAVGNFFLSLAKTFGDFDSPRHRHNFDQIRLQLEGDADFGRDGTMTPGMVGYFPEGVFYGPQSNKGDSLTLVLQFGGASCSGYLSEAEFQRGVADLKNTGSFEGGIYKRTAADGSIRSQDAYEAVWEHLTGRSLDYPESRYDKPVFMRPAAANWSDKRGQSGVRRKHLGTFSEARTVLSIVAIDQGAGLELPPNTIAFVLQGAGLAGGERWERHSSIYSGARSGTLVAESSSEILQIEMPELHP
jgi:hypothetical protein